MIALLLAACNGEPEAEDTVPAVLDDRAFRFCHVPGANSHDALRWCNLLDDLPPERCPGLRETCAGVVTQDPVGCEQLSEGEQDGLAGEPDRPPEEREGCDKLDMSGVESLVRWVAAIAVAVLVLVVFRLVWATFGRRKTRAAERSPAPAPAVAETELTDIPDAPSEDLLSAARRALSDGRYADVVLLARGAALRRMAEVGRVRLHRSRTDREYVRSVRNDAAVHEDLRVVVAATEGLRWEGRPMDRERAAGVLAAAERILGALVLLFVLLGAFPTPAAAQSYSRYMPEGDAALVELFRLYGYDAGWRLRSLGDLDENTDVLVLDTSVILLTDAQWGPIRAWVEEGAVLLVGGDAIPGFPELGVHTAIEGQPWVVEEAFAEAGLPAPIWPDSAIDVYSGTTGRALVSVGDDFDAVVILDVGLGVVVAIADPTLLLNGAFVHPDNERFLGDLVYLGQGLEGWPVDTPARVQLATRAAAAQQSSGGAANNPLGAMASAGLLLFVLQLLATWSLAGLWRGWPFAPLRDPPDEGRLSFVEHVNAIGTRYWRSGDAGYAAKQLAALWVARLGVEGLQSAAQRAGFAPDVARDWAQQIEALATGPVPASSDRSHLMSRMEELWRVTSHPMVRPPLSPVVPPR